MSTYTTPSCAAPHRHCPMMGALCLCQIQLRVWCLVLGDFWGWNDQGLSAKDDNQDGTYSGSRMRLNMATPVVHHKIRLVGHLHRGRARDRVRMQHHKKECGLVPKHLHPFVSSAKVALLTSATVRDCPHSFGPVRTCPQPPALICSCPQRAATIRKCP